uniref:Uncharacterized protein n=1 Tax=Anguilla anguilla TaxID=7936 RepID=A0A0E9VJW1_ANGAN
MRKIAAKKCEGKKVVKEVKILEVHVDKGIETWSEDHLRRGS